MRYTGSETTMRTKLVEARRVLGLSQIEAAQLIGTTQAWVSMVEQGHRTRRDVLVKIANLCDAYRALAIQRDLDPADYERWVLCPDDFREK